MKKLKNINVKKNPSCLIKISYGKLVNDMLYHVAQLHNQQS